MEFNDIMKNIWRDVQAQMPEHVKRLSWSKEQVREHQTKKLRELLRVAKEKAKYYGEILSDVDVEDLRFLVAGEASSTGVARFVSDKGDFGSRSMGFFLGASLGLASMTFRNRFFAIGLKLSNRLTSLRVRADSAASRSDTFGRRRDSGAC